MSTGRRRVAVIGGGRNGEHEVSLASALSAVQALRAVGWDVVPLTIERDGTWSNATGERGGLAQAVALLTSCDVALPLLHGPMGEDGTIAALLDLAGIPYVGSGVGAGAIAMDKWVTKLVAREIGVAVAPGSLLTARTAHSYSWNRPVVVKPVAAGSSLGVRLVDQPHQLDAAIDEALRHDDRLLIEDVVIGREIDVAVLGSADGSRVVSAALEIVVPGFFDYQAKYGGGAEFGVPAVLEDDQRKALEVAAVGMYDALGCRGVARIDFFVTPHGIVLNEVNTTPGFTAHSQAPLMFAATGLSYPQLLNTLLDDVLSWNHRGVN